MEKPGTAKPLLRALAGETMERPPFWLMRQAGRYLPEYRALRERAASFLEFCFSPELAAEATLQPIRRFGMDAAILFSDILVVPSALGRSVEFREGEGPVLEKLSTREEAEALALDGMVERLEPVYAAVEQVKTVLPHQTALIGFAGAPWTVATYMVEGGSSRDFAAVKEWALGAPSEFDRLIQLLVEATAAHLSAQIEAGAEIVQLFDTWAGIVPPDSFDRLVIEPTARIVAALRRNHPEVPIIGFPRGIGVRYADYFRMTCVDAVSIDSGLPLDLAAHALQPIGAVQGNLDPLLLVAGGAALDEAVAAILGALRQGPFIFNLGHGVLPQTPVAHVARIAELMRQA